MQKLELALYPSKIFLLVMTLLTLGSFVIIYSISLSVVLKFLLFIAVIIYSSHIILLDGLLQSKNSILNLTRNNSDWHLKTSIKTYRAKLLGDSVITTQLCILRFKIEGQRFKRSCIIVKDSIEKEEYRHLLLTIRTIKTNEIIQS